MKSLAVKELERQFADWHYSLHPLIPEGSRVVRKFDDSTANGLTRCILAFLQMEGHQAERINTMGRPIDNRRTYTDVLGNTRQIGSLTWAKSTSTRGSADISAIINGKPVKIEVKIGKDRQSAAQKAYQRAVELAGGVYFIAKDFESFMTFYKIITNK